MPTKNTTPAASVSRHTPEPWQCIQKETCLFIYGPDSKVVTDFPGNEGTEYQTELIALPYGCGEGTQNANSERIVACVNALAGMNPAAVAGLVEAAEYYERECVIGAVNVGQFRAKFYAAIAALKGGAL